jgi:hypothetical protein
MGITPVLEQPATITEVKIIIFSFFVIVFLYLITIIFVFEINLFIMH